MKLLWVILVLLIPLVADFVVSLVLGQSYYYNPNLKAYFSGLMASIIGIFMLLMIATSPKYKYSQKTLLIVGIIALILSVVSAVFQFAIRFYFGGWACLVWILVSILIIFYAKT